MRKLFRFKYEPCNGTCYAWCDHLIEELNRLPKEKQHKVVTSLVEAHARLCDNLDYSFGVDMSTDKQTFVAHFRTPEKTDLYSSKEFYACVMEVCKSVMSADIPQMQGQCAFGEHGSEDLGAEILRACADAVYREEKHSNCACKRAA